MSSPAYKSFALIGANDAVGKEILDALIAENASFVVLTRKSSGSSSKLPSNVKVVKVNYEDSAEVSAVLKENGVDVLISAINPAAGGKSQYDLADSAKSAGVKLFVGVWTGSFFSYLPGLIGYIVDQKFSIIGKGQSKASFTALEDVSGFVVSVLMHLPAEQLNDKIFRLQGEGLTLVEVATKAGLPHNNVDKLPGNLAESFFSELQVLIESGRGSTGWDYEANKEGKDKSGSTNALWPGHKWKDITPAIFSKP
ncbi:hypothetical protein DFS33DRAFT_1439430 [Desarmillaria ectypa]|nr:hypothetical protein DFS33DRAFT_1439430 [Desarmillaria ectypa]